MEDARTVRSDAMNLIENDCFLPKSLHGSELRYNEQEDLTYLVGIVPIVVLYLLKTVMISITLLHMDLMATECQRSILIFLVSNYPTFENIQGRFLEKIRCSLQGRF